MRLLTKIEIQTLVSNKELIIESESHQENINFLDDVRIGLSINEIFEVESEIDLLNLDNIKKQQISSDFLKLQRSKFYLGISGQKMSLSNNLLAIINTRSKYARIGLDVVNSSFWIIPGFGNAKATPIVFEITTQTNISNFKLGHFYAYVLIFQIDKNVNLFSIKKDYAKRFPFD